MTVAGTADRGFGLGHIPAATTGTLTRDWLSVFALCLLCVPDSYPEYGVRQMPTEQPAYCFTVFFSQLSVTKIRLSYLAPRSSSSPAQEAPRPLASSTSP